MNHTINRRLAALEIADKIPIKKFRKRSQGISSATMIHDRSNNFIGHVLSLVRAYTNHLMGI